MLVEIAIGDAYGAGFEYADVREAWASEPRCRDTDACAERVKALVPAVAEPAVAAEESGWVL